MSHLPTRIPGLVIATETASRRTDGSTRTVRPRRLGTKSELILHHEQVIAEYGYTCQPCFTARGHCDRSIVCREGEVFIVVVDVRLGSPQFGNWQGFYLTEADRRTLLIPTGVAVGWQVTVATASIEVGHSRPEADCKWRSLHWDDEQIQIAWPDVPNRLATQSRASRLLDDYCDSQLPTYANSSARPSRRTVTEEPRRRRRRKAVRVRVETDSRKNQPVREPELVEVKPLPQPKIVTQPSIEDRPILIIGSSGKLGRDLLRHGEKLGRVVGACRHTHNRVNQSQQHAYVDIARPASIRRVIRQVKPSLIINAAAMSDVDHAEVEPRLAQMINALAPAVIAEEAHRIDAGLIHFCSDMVFDGADEKPYRESDRPQPLNHYARTKLVGTQAVLASSAASMVFRTGWLYSAFGENYIRHIIDLATYRRTLSLAADHLGCPMSTDWLARTIVSLMADAKGNYLEWLKQHGRLYHVSLLGYTSRMEVGEWVLEAARQFGLPLALRNLQSASIHELPSVADQPANCQLDPSLFATHFGIQLPNWQDELRNQVDAMLRDRVAGEAITRDAVALTA